MHLNETRLLQLCLRFLIMEIKSYSTFPAFTLSLPLNMKLLNVVWMKPERSKIKTHDDVLGPKVTAMLTCYTSTYCDQCYPDTLRNLRPQFCGCSHENPQRASRSPHLRTCLARVFLLACSLLQKGHWCSFF